MCAISQALVCDCVSYVFILCQCVCPSSRLRSNIKVRYKPKYSIHGSIPLKTEMYRSILGVYESVHVCVHMFAADRVQGVLIKLAC